MLKRYILQNATKILKNGLLTPSTNVASSISENTRQKIEIPHYFAAVQTDNNSIFAIVCKDYQFVRKTEAFLFFDEIVGCDEGIHYELPTRLAKLNDFLLKPASSPVLK